MPHTSIFTFLCLTTLLIACHKDPDAPLQGCCDIPAINSTVGNAHIYLPNIFTPNGDGVNDYLWPYGDQFLISIISFQVRDKKGQLVYQAQDGIPNNPNVGWSGTVDGMIKEGMYSVTVQAKASDGTISTLEGKVCNFSCRDMDASDPLPIDGCQFPIQVTDGQFDPRLAPLENNDCFE